MPFVVSRRGLVAGAVLLISGFPLVAVDPKPADPAAVIGRLKLALLGRRAFWSGTPDQGGLTTTRPQKDALIQNLAAWASADFGTVNAPGLVVLQDQSDVVSNRYSWVQPILGFQIVADPRLASYSSVRSLTAAGNTRQTPSAQRAAPR